MNASPHTHELKIYTDNDGDIIIKYGDQPSHCVYPYWPGWRSRVGRCAKRMIRAHDRASLKAGERSALTAALKEKLVLRDASGLWGRDVLSGAVLPAPPTNPVGASVGASTGAAFGVAYWQRGGDGIYRLSCNGQQRYFYTKGETERWAWEHGVELVAS
jgi:hypothetical protein